MTTFTLIMFVILANGAQTAVRVGFEDQLACVTAGKALQQGFLASPDTASAKVVWSCNPSSMGAMPPTQDVIPQPPPVTDRRARPQTRRQAKTPPAEPAPARVSEEQRMKNALPEWLGGTRK